jgi:hypothetical protein
MRRLLSAPMSRPDDLAANHHRVDGEAVHPTPSTNHNNRSPVLR